MWKPSRKDRRRDSTKVVLLKQVTAHDLSIATMLREGAGMLSKDGHVLTVLSEGTHDDKHGYVQVQGTYHRVFDNEWGNTRYFKPGKNIERLIENFLEEE